MDVLIKRKCYKEALEFLNEKSSESDWNIFTESIKTNSDFLEYFKNFMINLKCHFKLKTFLLKIFCTNKDIQFQEIVYHIITHLHKSKSEFSSHFLIKNLLLVQVVKLAVLDQNNRYILEEYIRDKNINDAWFVELLENFQFWNELGDYYEIRGELEKSLAYYIKSNGNEEKVKELTDILNKSDVSKIKESNEEYLNESESELQLKKPARQGEGNVLNLKGEK